jgi:hypothetical protein
MKISQVHTIVKETLGHWFSSQGFKPSRRHSLTFEWQNETNELVVWFPGDRWGWDPYLGGGFRLLVARYPQGKDLPDYEQAFPYFLNDDELEMARKIHNTILSGLQAPPESYFTAIASKFKGSMASEVVEQLRREFQPLSAPYRWHHDFFLRYYTEDHVRLWCAFLAPVLPRIIQRAEDSWVREEP